MKKLFVLLLLMSSMVLSHKAEAQKGGIFTVGVQDTLTMSSSVDSAVYYLGFDVDATAPEGYCVDFTIWTKRISGTPVLVAYPETTNFNGKNSDLTKDFWARDWSQKDTLQIVTGSFSQSATFNAKAKNFRLVVRGSGTGQYIVRPAYYWRKKSNW